MVRLIGNVLVFGLTAILLSSCAAGVKVIDTYTIEKKREPLALADPKPLDLQDIDWIIITKDNADEVFEKIKFSGTAQQGNETNTITPANLYDGGQLKNQNNFKRIYKNENSLRSIAFKDLVSL